VLEDLKQRVCELNVGLHRERLVTMTGGNVSGRDPETGLVVIKPSGVSYDKMAPDDMVVVTAEGEVTEGNLKPSVDTATHLYVYRNRPGVNGMVHTHSTYATAFAAAGKALPVALTAIADEFGGPIPVGPYAPIGGEEIGRAICEHIGGGRAILMKQHGVFTIGETPEAAFRTAVMVEEVAKTCFLAMQLGDLEALPGEEVARAHRRYQEKYGQKR